MPERPDQRVEPLRAVRRGVDEHVRVDRSELGHRARSGARGGRAPARRRQRRRAAAAGTASVRRRRATPTRPPAAGRRTRRPAPTTTAPAPCGGVGPGCTNTGLPASSATRRTSADGLPAAGGCPAWSAGSCTPTKRPAQQLGRARRGPAPPSGPTPRRAKCSGSASAPRVPGVDAARRPRPAGSDSIPSGAERLTQASPMPASAVQRDPPADVVVGRLDVVRPARPSVCSVQPRRYGARVRRRSSSTNGSGHRCWCRSIAGISLPFISQVSYYTLCALRSRTRRCTAIG